MTSPTHKKATEEDWATLPFLPDLDSTADQVEHMFPTASPPPLIEKTDMPPPPPRTGSKRKHTQIEAGGRGGGGGSRRRDRDDTSPERVAARAGVVPITPSISQILIPRSTLILFEQVVEVVQRIALQSSARLDDWVTVHWPAEYGKAPHLGSARWFFHPNLAKALKYIGESRNAKVSEQLLKIPHVWIRPSPCIMVFRLSFSSLAVQHFHRMYTP